MTKKLSCRFQILEVVGDPKYVVPQVLREYANLIERGEVLWQDSPFEGKAPPIPSREPLTPIQARCYEEVGKYVRQWGYGPSIRELCRVLGLKSTNSARDTLLILARKGYIIYTSGKARSLRLV